MLNYLLLLHLCHLSDAVFPLRSAVKALRKKGLLCLSLEGIKETNTKGWWQLLKEREAD